MGEELVVGLKNQAQSLGKQLFEKLLETAIEKYDVVAMNGTTYSGKNGMPYVWYERIGFKKVDNLFLVNGDAKQILSNLKREI